MFVLLLATQTSAVTGLACAMSASKRPCICGDIVCRDGIKTTCTVEVPLHCQSLAIVLVKPPRQMGTTGSVALCGVVPIADTMSVFAAGTYQPFRGTITTVLASRMACYQRLFNTNTACCATNAGDHPCISQRDGNRSPPPPTHIPLSARSFKT